MIEKVTEGLQNQSDQLQTIMEYLPSYELAEDVASDFYERLETIKDEIDSQINNIEGMDWIDFSKPKDLAQLGHFGTPTQQDWAKEFVDEYNSLIQN